MWNLESIFEYKRQKLKKEHAHFKILSRGEMFTLFFFYFFHPRMKLHPCLFDRNEFIPRWNFISTKTCKRHFSIDRDDFILGRVSSQDEFSRVNTLLGFKKLFNKRFAFPPLYRDFYRLLLATSKGHCVPRMLLVLDIN